MTSNVEATNDPFYETIVISQETSRIAGTPFILPIVSLDSAGWVSDDIRENYWKSAVETDRNPYRKIDEEMLQQILREFIFVL
jgi:hypothetical protein